MSLLRASEVRIRRRVESLLEGLASVPVDVGALAQRVGAEVREMPLAPDLSGVLYWEDERKVVVVNASHPAARWRVSIARQLGHIVLHRRRAVRTDEGLRIDLRSPLQASVEGIEEVEASLFALHLLMPSESLGAEVAGPVFDFANDAVFEALAKRYEVPLPALVFRLALTSWG